MGRLAIILVTAMGIYLAQSFSSSNETSYRVAEKQAEHQEAHLAREIARTGFNVAMGILRSHGDDLVAGVAAVNGYGGYMEGAYQGGTYRAYARFTSGHAVEVVSAGYFGGTFASTNTASAFNNDDPCAPYKEGGCHKMDDVYEYTLPTTPLRVKENSLLTITFIDSMAGYCSAIYLERFDGEGNRLADPQMVFPAGKNRNGAALTVSDTLEAGTQMNFFIGVDQNCSTAQDWNSFTPLPFDEHDYDHVHYAFDGAITDMSSATESIWALVEQHPDDNQRWRIGWEDQHHTTWDNAASDDPTNSLQALKAFGYDGNGWPSTDSRGYRNLRDYGSRPDFSDQVIEIGLTPIEEEPVAGGSEEPVPGGGEETSEETGTGEESGTEEEPGTEEESGSESGTGTVDEELGTGEEEPTGEESSGSEDDTGEEAEGDDGWEDGASCYCAPQNKKKVYIRHFTNSQTNPYNDICISVNALDFHMKNHDDFVLCRADVNP